ncbi:MAG: hypothetical protein WD810_00410 [Solirubrobacterales bacterium]
MFDTKTSIAGRLTDAVDLLIDFATLGEYGLEPVGRTSRACAERSVTPRQRPSAPRTAARTTRCSLLQEAGFRGSRPNAARQQGVRGASGTSQASGVA